MDQKFIIEKINDHDKRINELEKNHVKADTLINQFMKTSDELSSTMKDISRTMVEVQNNLANNTREIGEINKKMDCLNTKVDTDIDKNKIDMRNISKEGMTKILMNLGKVGVGASAVYGIYELIK